MNPTARPFVPKFVPPPPPGPSPLQRAEDKISTLEQQVATLQVEKTLSDQRYSDSLRTVTFERDRAITASTILTKHLEKSLTDNATIHNELAEALTKLKKRDAHQARADNAICDLRDAQAKIERMQAELQAIRAERDQAIAHKTELQADMEECQRANTMLRNISTRQHAQIEEHQKTIAELRKQLETRPVTNPISPPARSMSEWLLCSIDILETSTLGAVHVIHSCHTEPDFKKDLPLISHRMDHIVNRLLPLHAGLKEMMAKKSLSTPSLGEQFRQEMGLGKRGLFSIMPS